MPGSRQCTISTDSVQPIPPGGANLLRDAGPRVLVDDGGPDQDRHAGRDRGRSLFVWAMVLSDALDGSPLLARAVADAAVAATISRRVGRRLDRAGSGWHSRISGA